MKNQGLCSIDRNRYGRFLRNTLCCVMALFLLVTMGCATVGKEFPVSRVSDIEINVTTQDRIRAMFGSPWRVGIEDGQQTWTYGKYRYSAFKETSTQDLVIRFNDKGVVSSYTFNTTDHSE